MYFVDRLILAVYRWIEEHNLDSKPRLVGVVASPLRFPRCSAVDVPSLRRSVSFAMQFLYFVAASGLMSVVPKPLLCLLLTALSSLGKAMFFLLAGFLLSSSFSLLGLNFKSAFLLHRCFGGKSSPLVADLQPLVESSVVVCLLFCVICI